MVADAFQTFSQLEQIISSRAHVGDVARHMRDV
jgi:hypothetical protein